MESRRRIGGMLSHITPTPTASVDDIPVIDTHQHMWYLNHWSCPWLDGLTINHDFTMEDYTAATSGNGVQKTIFLETAAATEDLDKEDAYILDLCSDPTTLVSAAVFGCDMEAPDFKERVTRLAASEYVKGIRQVFYADEEPGFSISDACIAGVRFIGESGLTFDICEQPHRLLDVATMVSQAPGTTFILDHCGGHQGLSGTCPEQGERDESQHKLWKEGIVACAKLPNMVAKVSGLYGGWTGGMEAGTWTLDLQKETMDFVMDTFPPDRVVFGVDYPLCEGAEPGVHAKYLAGMKAYVLETRGLEYAKGLFHDNAVRVYNL